MRYSSPDPTASRSSPVSMPSPPSSLEALDTFRAGITSRHPGDTFPSPEMSRSGFSARRPFGVSPAAAPAAHRQCRHKPTLT
eukprot:590515-Pyramimonas_sp.AAC.1